MNDAMKKIDELLKAISRRLAVLEQRTDSAFANREQKTEGLNFGEALALLKQGYRLGRWFTPDVYIFYVPEDGDKEDGGKGAYIGVRAMDRKLYPWMPNHQELLAENWRVIDADE